MRSAWLHTDRGRSAAVLMGMVSVHSTAAELVNCQAVLAGHVAEAAAHLQHVARGGAAVGKRVCVVHRHRLEVALQVAQLRL